MWGSVEFQLVLIGMLGVLAHNFKKISDDQKKKGFAIRKYFKEEWGSIGMSICLVFMLVIAHKEIPSIKIINGMPLYLTMGMWGYAGQSIFLSIVAAVRKLLKNKLDAVSGE